MQLKRTGLDNLENHDCYVINSESEILGISSDRQTKFVNIDNFWYKGISTPKSDSTTYNCYTLQEIKALPPLNAELLPGYWGLAFGLAVSIITLALLMVIKPFIRRF